MQPQEFHSNWRSHLKKEVAIGYLDHCVAKAYFERSQENLDKLRDYIEFAKTVGILHTSQEARPYERAYLGMKKEFDTPQQHTE